MLNLSQNNHYQIACTKYFEVLHRSPMRPTAINHPNQFYEESLKLRGYKKQKSKFNVESSRNDSKSFLYLMIFYC